VAGQAADLCQLLARDPHPRAAGHSSQAPIDPVELPRLAERAAFE
jgi:hypothetical protein